MFMFYSFWCCVLNDILIMGLLHMLLNTLVNFFTHGWFILCVYGLMIIYKFIFSVYVLWVFVPLLCSVVLVV